MAITGLFFILDLMPLVSRLVFQAIRWAARKGLRQTEGEALSPESKKLESRQTGIRGETYAYWYLRRHGYVFVERNFTPRASKGEIDMVSYDGETLAFVEVRTRTVRDEMSALPELSVTPGKQHLLARTARHFLAERRVGECPCRFDVVAIDDSPGRPPVVRLHKDAFSPKCKIPQENRAERLLSTARRGTIGPQGVCTPSNSEPCRGGLLCRSCEKTPSLAAG